MEWRSLGGCQRVVQGAAWSLHPSVWRRLQSGGEPYWGVTGGHPTTQRFLQWKNIGAAYRIIAFTSLRNCPITVNSSADCGVYSWPECNRICTTMWHW